jgi:hypothetical protein
MDLHITIRRTWCGKTRARITGQSAGYEVDVTVTGWRRASVLTEAQQTFDAVASNPARFLKGHRDDAARIRGRRLVQRPAAHRSRE